MNETWKEIQAFLEATAEDQEDVKWLADRLASCGSLGLSNEATARHFLRALISMAAGYDGITDLLATTLKQDRHDAQPTEEDDG